MAIFNIAVILKREPEFLLLRQTPPPKFGVPEYDSFVDSDLWDLPSTRLNLLERNSEPRIAVGGLGESCSEKIELRKFDVDLAIDRVLEKLGIGESDCGNWRFWGFVEEAEFGPGLPINTVFLVANLVLGDHIFQESCRWMCTESCLKWLVDVKPSSDRVGPLVVASLLNESSQSRTWKVPRSLNFQEYPPGVTIVPMRSRTLTPFRTTNLIVFVPDNLSNDCGNGDFIVRGDALIVDPGCLSRQHNELRDIVASLPEKLVVFVTHHHRDHIDGLSVVQQCNPKAVLLAHENTARRIGKGIWSLGCTLISGGEDICIGGQRFNVIYAPGHTDGHMALLHVSTKSLIVGDHCVGQGSTILDINSGGNMKEYFDTSYKFMDLSPHALVPMHGRVNLWPKHMLCGYLKNRRSREMTILRTIENGAQTLFDVVATVYPDVDRFFWIPASSNVRLHVDNLEQQDKLPKEFSVQKFKKTCHAQFYIRWFFAYIIGRIKLKHPELTLKVVLGVSVAAFAVYYYSVKNKIDLS